MFAGSRLAARLAALGMVGVLLALPACATPTGNFSILGYTTAPNYDPNIKTVRVPIFKNRTTIQGLEFDLTRTVCRTIATTTPFRVLNDDPVAPGCADTELVGTITDFTKAVTLATPIGETRQAQITLVVEVVWRDLRTGEVLSKAARRPGEPPRPEGPGQPPVPFVPNPSLQKVVGPTIPPFPGPAPAEGDDRPAERPAPVIVRGTSSFVPEIGQSISTSEQDCYNKVALEIVHLMEKPW